MSADPTPELLTARTKRNWDAEIAATTTSEQCDILADDCMKEAIEIEGQLEFASVENNIDVAWLIAAKTALKHRKRYHQKILLRKGHLSRTENRAREIIQKENWTATFVIAAKEFLAPELYKRIVELAQKKLSETL